MRRKLIAATAALLMSAGSAHAAIVSFSTPINVPNTVEGVYVNLATGASNTNSTFLPGWDFNAYSSGGALAFFWLSPGSSPGGVVASSAGPYLDLAPGAVISSASSFSQNAQPPASAAFRTTGTHTLGLRFLNESTGAINYGYLTLQTTGTSGFPATITGWSFDNTGSAITVAGATSAVPEPATWAMMVVGFGAIAATLRRRRTKAGPAFA